MSPPGYVSGFGFSTIVILVGAAPPSSVMRPWLPAITASLPIAASMETVNCAVARRSVSNSTVAPIVVKMPYLPRTNPLDRAAGKAKS